MHGTVRRVQRRHLLAIAALAFLWCLPGIAVRSTFGAHVAVDEPQYLLSATSLAEDLDLDISDELADERWRDYHQAELPTQTRVLDGGRQVSPHDPLLPLLLAGPMRVGGWIGAKVAMAAMAGALAAALAWVSVVRLDIAVRRTLLGVACFSLAAPLAVYGTQVYPELPGALALTLGVAAALGPTGRRQAVGVGLAVSALPWLSVKYAPVAVALAAAVLWRQWRAGERRLALGLLGALALSAAAFTLGHLAIYDGLTPYATGDHFVGGELDVVGTSPNYDARARRYLGLFVDRDFGLAAWQPAWLLVLPALGALLRRRPGWTALIGLPALAGWTTASLVALTMHGYWWPGRQTVVVLPLLALLALWWASQRLLTMGAVAGAVTWAWLLADGLADRLTWVVGFEARGGPVRSVARLLLPDLRRWDGADQAGLAVWLVVAGVLVGWGASGRGGGQRPHQDAVGGEGADAHHPVIEAHGDGAVR